MTTEFNHGREMDKGEGKPIVIEPPPYNPQKGKEVWAVHTSLSAMVRAKIVDFDERTITAELQDGRGVEAAERRDLDFQVCGLIAENEKYLFFANRDYALTSLRKRNLRNCIDSIEEICKGFEEILEKESGNMFDTTKQDLEAMTIVEYKNKVKCCCNDTCESEENEED